MFEIKGKVNTAICYRSLKDSKRLERSLGTLGGGNHFIEVEESADGTKYLVIHSGSRNLGKQESILKITCTTWRYARHLPEEAGKRWLR